MVLRKIKFDNSVRCVPITEKTKERQNKPKTIKVGSLLRKQNKNTSQNNKKFFKKLSAQEFKYLKWIMNCYF